MPRNDLLSKDEQKRFDTPPQFTNAQKEYFFKLPAELEERLNAFDNDTSKVTFILLYGYFRVTHIFFKLDYTPLKDIEFIKKMYSLHYEITIPPNVRTLRRHKVLIKEFLGIRAYDESIHLNLTKEAQNHAGNFLHRKKIFYALVDAAKNLRIEVPSYTQLSQIISDAQNLHKHEILNKLSVFMPDDRLQVLEEFLDKDESYKNRYVIMRYKQLEHSTKTKKIAESLARYRTIQSKYTQCQPIISTIGLTPAIAQHYARWIEKSQVFQITNKNDTDVYFLLLAFIYYQYLIRNDNLIDRFISVVQSAKNSATRAQKELSHTQAPAKNKLIEALQDSNLSIINTIAAITKDTSLAANKKVEEIEKVLEVHTVHIKSIMSENDKIDAVGSNPFDVIETKSISLQGKLSGILREIEFDEVSSNKHLIEAINHFKTTGGAITKTAPVKFLESDAQKALVDDGKFRVSLYKVLLFIAVSDGIKSGTLNLKHSYRYQNFDHYLIDKTAWINHREKILALNDMQHLKEMELFLEPIRHKLHQSYTTTNERIRKELNTDFTSTADSFYLKTPCVVKEDEDDTIGTYLPHESCLSIIDILGSINHITGFSEHLNHFNPAVKNKVDSHLLFAAILGYGCNIDVSKMGKISKGINQNQLDTAKIWYFTEENTIEANNRIIEFMNNLHIIKLLKHDQEINHTASDGQKFNMKSSIDSMNAGYSFKYFGTAKGVSVYTFIDESHRLFYSTVINATERESGYVIDGLMHNDVVKSDIHSTDTYGFSEVIFGLTHLLSFSFAPRIKNFKHQQLYSFSSVKECQQLGYTLLPKHKINVELIQEHWDDILRFIATIKTKKTTASQLLRRLTSYSRQHRLYAALKEFGKIIKTDFLLTYIDDVELRQRIEKQLNKVENSNKFSKAVFFGNNSEFQVATAEEQNIANNCKRLIQNAVILWNYLYMSQKIKDSKKAEDRERIIKAIQNGSIVHWSHINFYGEYDFTRLDKRHEEYFNVDALKNLDISR